MQEETPRELRDGEGPGSAPLLSPDQAATAMGLDPTHVLVGRMCNLTRAVIADIDAFLQAGACVTHGAAEFAIAHLVCRSVADVKVGEFLAGEGFVVQALSAIKPIPESLNLIRLFDQESGRAEDWVEGRKHQQFAAAAVRKALGLGEDDFYAAVCERSHPRFAGAQLSGWSESPGSGILTTGGLPLEHWSVRTTAMTIGLLSQAVAFAAGKVRLDVDVARRWPTLMRSVSERLLHGVEEVSASLRREGRDDDGDLAQVLRGGLEAARELERHAKP